MAFHRLSPLDRLSSDERGKIKACSAIKIGDRTSHFGGEFVKKYVIFSNLFDRSIKQDKPQVFDFVSVNIMLRLFEWELPEDSLP